MADLDRIRSDVAYFAEVIGQPLTDWQAASVRLKTLLTVLVAGRQLGKSRTLAVLALWWAYTRPGHRVMIVSAGELGARRLLSDIRRMAASSPLLAGSVVDEQAALLTLSTGSEIRSVPASERAIRGWQNDLLLLDEAGSPTADVTLSAALPTVTARPHARVVMADSAWAANGPFYDQATRGLQGAEDVRTFRWVAHAAGGEHDAPWVTPSLVAMARESLGSLRFNAEYRGEFASASDSMFSRELLASIAAPMIVPGPGALTDQAQVFGGCDWGATYDRSAFVAIGRLPVAALNDHTGEDARRPVFGVVAMKAWAPGTPLTAVVDEVGACRAPWAVLSSERNGIGEAPSQQLQRAVASRPRTGGRRASGIVYWNPVFTTAELKAQAYGSLHLLAERGQLVIPAETELLRELAGLRVELRSTGGVGIEAGGGAGHDDLADAAMLATAPYKDPNAKGRLTTMLGRLAETPSPSSRPTIPADAPVVTTGAGLRVWKRPVVQSVGVAPRRGLLLDAHAAWSETKPSRAENRWLTALNTQGGS